MLLGDENQAIREGTISFAEIKELAEADDKKFVELPLMTSYRSSPEITDMFASLLPSEKKMLVSSVQRPGEEVSVKACKSDKERLGKRTASASNSTGCVLTVTK